MPVEWGHLIQGGITAVIAVAASTGAVSTMLKAQDARIYDQDKKLKEHEALLARKADAEMCSVKHAQIDIAFAKGDTKFDRIDGKLDAINTHLGAMSTKLDLLMEGKIK